MNRTAPSRIIRLTASKAANLVVAAAATVVHAAQGGGVFVPDEVEAERRTACLACPLWNPAGNLGLGECTKCGCTGYKLRIASQRCPDDPPKWLEWDKPAP